MKGLARFVGTLGLISLLGTGVAFAKKGVGPGQYYPPNIDPAKAQEFCKEIQPLWQKQWQLSSELRTLWGQNPPNWEALLNKEIEIQKIRLEIQKKAYEKGLPYGPRKGLNIRRLCGW